jgi:hypothetical protein
MSACKCVRYSCDSEEEEEILGSLPSRINGIGNFEKNIKYIRIPAKTQQTVAHCAKVNVWNET